MKKYKNIKDLFISTLLMFFGMNAYADVEQDVIFVTSVSYSASVVKSNSSVESATIDPATGTHSGLSSVFDVETNGTDDNFDLIITSKVEYNGGVTSAYGDDGRLLFAHTTNLPSVEAIENAKEGIAGNKNVIAYGTQINTTNGFTGSFHSNYLNYGNCYVIKINNADTSKITHLVLTSPSTNTYDVTDEQGSYKSIISFTVVAK